MILITPDGERTMNTFLGACQSLGPGRHRRGGRRRRRDHLSRRLSLGSAGGQGSVPPRRVDRPRRRPEGVADAVRPVLRRPLPGRVPRPDPRRDRSTSCSPTIPNCARSTRPRASTPRSRRWPATARCPRSPSAPTARWWSAATASRRCPPSPVDAVVDLTGAGDLFASGFLFGLARGMDQVHAARLGVLAAGEVIGHIGPRPATSLGDVARQAGFEI